MATRHDGSTPVDARFQGADASRGEWQSGVDKQRTTREVLRMPTVRPYSSSVPNRRAGRKCKTADGGGAAIWGWFGRTPSCTTDTADRGRSKASDNAGGGGPG